MKKKFEFKKILGFLLLGTLLGFFYYLSWQPMKNLIENLFIEKDLIDTITYHIYFNINSDTLQYKDKEKLKEISQDNRRIGEISIIAYADSIGEGEYNHNLSKRRAQKIANILIEFRIPENSLSLEWLGKLKQDSKREAIIKYNITKNKLMKE